MCIRQNICMWYGDMMHALNYFRSHLWKFPSLMSLQYGILLRDVSRIFIRLVYAWLKCFSKLSQVSSAGGQLNHVVRLVSNFRVSFICYCDFSRLATDAILAKSSIALKITTSGSLTLYTIICILFSSSHRQCDGTSPYR